MDAKNRTLGEDRQCRGTGDEGNNVEKETKNEWTGDNIPENINITRVDLLDPKIRTEFYELM